MHVHRLLSACRATVGGGALARSEVSLALREQQPENENDGAALLIAASANVMAGIIASFLMTRER